MERDPEKALKDLEQQFVYIAIMVAAATPEAAEKLAEILAEQNPHLLMKALEKRCQSIAEKVAAIPKASLAVMPRPAKRARQRSGS